MSNQLSKAATMFWAGLIARAWEDDKFKKDLIKDPKKVLTDMGFMKFLDQNGTEGDIKVEEATSGDSCLFDQATNTFTFYLPKKPECGQLVFEGEFTAGAC
ncbi:MAG: hypothetical protein GY765_35540 [bacterium]|nr:hypothetical protein [bacterium]